MLLPLLYATQIRLWEIFFRIWLPTPPERQKRSYSDREDIWRK
jgi:hypothetical protein